MVVVGLLPDFSFLLTFDKVSKVNTQITVLVAQNVTDMIDHATIFVIICGSLY